jgi:hypothetical protein
MSNANQDTEQWNRADSRIFWGEIAPTDHVVQIYENDQAFLQLLEGFVSVGLKNLECVIIIATASHKDGLVSRLHNQGFDVNRLTDDDQLILLDAEEVLNKFMINDWPDEELFTETISQVILKANNRQRQIRAFGEMVALLWSKGLSGATVRLESLWNRFCASQKFCLFCAYPKSGFTQNSVSSIESICNCHSKMISGEYQPGKEIFYKSIH